MSRLAEAGQNRVQRMCSSAGPADDATRVRVNRRREVDPSLPGAQVGNIANPHLVQLPGIPLSLHDAVDDIPTVVGDYGKTRLAFKIGN